MEQQITPNYNLINKYFNDGAVSKKYFQNHFDYFKNKSQFKDFTKLLKDYRLSEDNNLYFFWVYYFDRAEFCKWFKEVELFKIWNSYNKDLINLKNLFTDIESNYFSIPEQPLNRIKPLYLKSISFELINSNGIPETTTIKTHPLMYDLILQLKDFVESLQSKHKPKEKNVKTYLKDFILGTKPFFFYIKNKHFKSESKNKLYDFIGKFICTLGIDLEDIYSIPASEKIKDIYKKGKSTPK